MIIEKINNLFMPRSGGRFTGTVYLKDGTDINVGITSKVNKSGDTMTGHLIGVSTNSDASIFRNISVVDANGVAVATNSIEMVRK